MVTRRLESGRRGIGDENGSCIATVWTALFSAKTRSLDLKPDHLKPGFRSSLCL